MVHLEGKNTLDIIYLQQRYAGVLHYKLCKKKLKTVFMRDQLFALKISIPTLYCYTYDSLQN
jgi:hypothetical protein